jgi:WD40 repeat protein
MITFYNENLIKLIFCNFTLYDLQTQFHILKNKIINRVSLNILSYDKMFKLMGRSKLIFSAVDQILLSSLVILPNGNLLSASHDKTIRFWDMKRGLCIKTLITEGRICTSAVLQNGIILAYLYGRTFQFWNDYGEGSTRVIEISNFETFHLPLFLSNGDFVFISALQIGYTNLILLSLKDDYQSIRILDNYEEGLIVKVCNITNNLFYSLSSEPAAFKVYDICKDYRCVYTIGEWLMPSIVINNMLFITNNNIRILDINNEYKYLHCLKGHREFVNDLIFIEKNRLLLSGSRDHTIKVWDANNYCCIRTVDIGGFFTKFLFTKNGYFAAVIGNKISIWDSVSFQCISTFESIVRLTYFELLDDNRILSYASRGNFIIWSY